MAPVSAVPWLFLQEILAKEIYQLHCAPHAGPPLGSADSEGLRPHAPTPWERNARCVRSLARVELPSVTSTSISTLSHELLSEAVPKRFAKHSAQSCIEFSTLVTRARLHNRQKRPLETSEGSQERSKMLRESFPKPPGGRSGHPWEPFGAPEEP